MSGLVSDVSREHLLHLLYEAAELEHTLMCTYLYAAFSLREGEAEGLTARESQVVEGWRRTIVQVAIEEMGHLAAVWNMTSALGGTPHFDRANFPLDPGLLPAGIVVKLAPFGDAALQHFVHLERPADSLEPEGIGFEPEVVFDRGNPRTRLVPMGLNYETVGVFYATLGNQLRSFAETLGEEQAFCGDPALQLSANELSLKGATAIRCLKTALAAFHVIIEQGEGAPEHSADSHFSRFAEIRAQLAELRNERVDFAPAFPAAVNPVLRRPFRAQRVWLENEEAVVTVDLANATYTTMLRLLAYTYGIPSGDPEKQIAVDSALSLMHAVTSLGMHAARLPAGQSDPHCNAGMTFTALRDASPFPQGPGARRYFVEQLGKLAAVAKDLATSGHPRLETAAQLLAAAAERGARRFSAIESAPRSDARAPSGRAPRPISTGAVSDGVVTTPVPTEVNGVEHIAGKRLTLLFEARRCIHARFCVTGAPNVFLANVQGPWIRPDAVPMERLVEIAHACPSGAIRYEPLDGTADEPVPQVNLIAVREAGPYAVRADLDLAGRVGEYRATLCRCGASKNKPYCDGSHHDVGFAASGEPATGAAEMLAVRDGRLSVEPQVNGPLQVRGNLEVTSGTGRVVARLTQAALCRCGGSGNKPFCDGTHARIGFRAP